MKPNHFTTCPSCQSNMVRLESGPSEVRTCLSCNSRWSVGGTAGMPFTANLLGKADPMPTPKPTKAKPLTPVQQQFRDLLRESVDICRERHTHRLTVNAPAPLVAPGSVPPPPPPGPLLPPKMEFPAPTPKTTGRG